VWEGLRHQIFLGREAFDDRFLDGTKKLEALRRLLADLEGDHVRREAMARAFLTGVYSGVGHR
jgi:REP-associated tyrosine transposase